MSDQHPQIIFIKRRGGHEEEHHGGAWKIAFADFMTAMMAFFLVLWIINATDKNTKTIIARYFNPVKLENAAKSKKGIHGGAQPTKDSEKDGAKEAGDPQEGAPSKADSKAQDKAASEPSGKGADRSKQEIVAALAAPIDPAAPKAAMSESQLFADPYKSLDLIAGAQPAKSGEAGAIVDAFRDPFRPIGPEVGGNGASAENNEPPPAGAPSTESAPEPAAEAQSHSAKPAAPANGATAPDAEKRLAAAAAQLLEDLRQKLGASASAKPGPSIDVKATDEGLLISLTDQLTFAMFPVGSAEPQAKVLQAMEAIAKILQARPGAIVIRGHTDGRPYKSADYDNWRLSSARAQMAYYMLTRAGLPDSRFERIEGYADRRLRDASHPGAAENRRIEILLREAK